MSLTAELTEFKNNFNANAPAEVQATMKSALDELIADKVGDRAVKSGDKFPGFVLKNQNNESINIDDLFKDNKLLIVNFYRGGWCPYCNLELKALQDKKEEFRKLGAELVAITPETPDNSLSTSQKNELDFNILTDQNGELSKELGIAFDLPENLRPLYLQFGIEVEKHNGSGVFTLPIPGTYILNENKEVIFHYLDLDYTKRLDPADIISFLNK